MKHFGTLELTMHDRLWGHGSLCTLEAPDSFKSPHGIGHQWVPLTFILSAPLVLGAPLALHLGPHGLQMG